MWCRWALTVCWQDVYDEQQVSDEERMGKNLTHDGIVGIIYSLASSESFPRRSHVVLDRTRGICPNRIGVYYSRDLVCLRVMT